MRSPEKVRFLKEEPGWPSGKICEKKIKYATKDVPRFRHQKSGRTVFLNAPRDTVCASITPATASQPAQERMVKPGVLRDANVLSCDPAESKIFSVLNRSCASVLHEDHFSQESTDHARL